MRTRLECETSGSSRVLGVWNVTTESSLKLPNSTSAFTLVSAKLSSVPYVHWFSTSPTRMKQLPAETLNIPYRK